MAENCKISWRLAESQDADALARVRRQAWESAYRGIYPDELLDGFDYRDHAARFLRNMENPDMKVYILEDGSEAVGFFVISDPERPFYKDFPVCLNALYLIPAYHRMGIGRRMMDFARDWCRQRGYNRFFLSCNLYNHRARAFYEAMGGVLGEIDNGNPDPGADVCYYEFDLGGRYVESTV